MAELLALLPFAVFVALLAGARLSAAQAGLWSAAVALAVAVAGFAYPVGLLSLAGPLLEAAFIAAGILWIIFPALGIYEYQARTGAIAEIGRWLTSFSSRPQIHALLLAWFFAMFLEGAAGFGTPIALVAPMLVGLGFPPIRALALALLGHAVGVSFGAVGTPIVPLLEAAPVDPRALSGAIVLLHGALGWTMALLVFRLARGGEGATPARWYVPFAGAALFFVPAAALAWIAGPELPTLAGALAGGLLFAILFRDRGAAAKSHPVPALVAAASPYLFVLALILVTRLTAPVAETLRGLTLSWNIGAEFGGSIAPLYHPGTMLMLALLAAAAIDRKGRGSLPGALRSAAARLPLVALALVSVLLLARLMVHGGMIETLAFAAAGLLGEGWLLAAPLVGALGSFVTGSATASNIILAELQVATSAAVGIAPLLALAGQGFGSAIGNIVAPHNIVAGAATVGLIGREGEVLRKTLLPCVLYATAGGMLLLLAGTLL